MEYVTENGDTVEARGLTLKVELGEKTRNEIVSQAMAQVQDATETIERLTHALADADAENAKLRALVIAYADSFESSAALNNGDGPYYSGEDWLGLANDMRLELAECRDELGIEVE